MVSVVDENTAWAFKWGGLYRTTDAGNTWSPVGWFTSHSTHAASNPQKLCAVDADTAWFSMWNIGYIFAPTLIIYWTVYWTTDGGITWSKYDMNMISCTAYSFIEYPDGVSGIDVADDGSVWVSTYSLSPQLSKTTDNGVSWHHYDLGNLYIFDICAFDADNAWAVGVETMTSLGNGTGVIVRTSDGGATWQVQERLNTIPAGISAADEQTAWVVGDLDLPYHPADKGIIFKTTDGGNTWVTQYEEDGACLMDVCAIDADTAWAAGRHADGSPLMLKTESGGNPVPPKPFISSISPSPAPWNTLLTITGSGFGEERGESYVSFGETMIEDYESWSDGSITLKAPENVEGEVAVTVTTPGGTSDPVVFHGLGALTIESVTPAVGSQLDLFLAIDGISGNGFLPVASVRLEKGTAVLNAYGVNVESHDKATCTVTLFGAEPGVYDVVLTIPDGLEARLPEAFTVSSACGAGSGTALLALGLTLGAMSVVGTLRAKRGRR
ncbi:MAG: hypothetical protein HPY75_02105 [Actinobacteria bacterium]|nr:hypothetical protein [Actinomycetota bacterium]